MATTTAIILIGTSHPNHGGISPTHMIRLTENDRPALILTGVDRNTVPKVIIPTVENMVDDIFLMISGFIQNRVIDLAKNPLLHGSCLYEILTDEERMTMYHQCREGLRGSGLKVIFSMFTGCHLLTLRDQINKYPVDFEVTIPQQFHFFSSPHL